MRNILARRVCVIKAESLKTVKRGIKKHAIIQAHNKANGDELVTYFIVYILHTTPATTTPCL